MLVRRGKTPARSGLPEEYYPCGNEDRSDHINTEKQLREIARDKHYWGEARSIRLTDPQRSGVGAELCRAVGEDRAERQEILKKAKQEARRLIADANKQIENTIKTIREWAEGADAAGAARAGRLPRGGREGRRGREQSRRGPRDPGRIERRRRRRAERRAQQGAQPAARGGRSQPEKPREVVAGSKVRMAGQEMVGDCSR